MPDFSQRYVQVQKHKFSHKLTPNIRAVQELTLLYQHQLMQRIDHELSQNPALELETEADVLDRLEPQENDDDYNPDYDKPPDEYETGDPSTSQENVAIDFSDIATNLEQAAVQRAIGHPDQLERSLQHIDYYRIHGYLPEDADPQLQEDLAGLQNSLSYQTVPSIHPTFEVMVEGDHVEASAVPAGLNLRDVSGLGVYSTIAKRFINLHHDRNRLLNDLAYCILEVLQADFFRQHDLDTALRHLLPVPIEDLSKLLGKQPFNIEEKYLSKLGDHLVSCHLGIFPLNYFLPKKAQIVRVWVHFAQEKGNVTKREQVDWIKNQLEERTMKWDENDIRHEYIKHLKKINIDDIKNFRKYIKKAGMKNEVKLG